MFNAIAESFYRNFIERDRYKIILTGFELTLILTVACFIASILLGILLCAGLKSRYKSVRVIVSAYNSIIDKVPPIVLLMIFSYVIFKSTSVQSVYIAFIGLTIRQASSMADIFHNGLCSVKVGEIDAARTLGMSREQAFYHITLPQAARTISPLFRTQFVVCMQNTSVVSMLGVSDMTNSVNLVSIQTFDPYLSVMVSTVAYLVIGYAGDMIISLFTKERHIKSTEKTA